MVWGTRKAVLSVLVNGFGSGQFWFLASPRARLDPQRVHSNPTEADMDAVTSGTDVVSPAEEAVSSDVDDPVSPMGG